MKLFRCDCDAQIFFENTQCLSCGRELGFIPSQFELSALPNGSTEFMVAGSAWRKCRNYSHEGVCNWMSPTRSPSDLCQACEFNHVIPDLSEAENRALWLEVERSKRRLIYSLNRLGLPVIPKTIDPGNGLSFDIKASSGHERILTGHLDGNITLNLAEADPAQREQVRMAMRERYRTLLGHFRHEIGHYYFGLMVHEPYILARCRERFGDESVDYGEALKEHYGQANHLMYQDAFISSYAMAHPSEDFAETFAHYLHMVDTLETALEFGFVSERLTKAFPQIQASFDLLMREWMGLSIALNSLNRSMGLLDAYPFSISEKVGEKLRFIHDLIHSLEQSASMPRSSESVAAAPQLAAP